MKKLILLLITFLSIFATAQVEANTFGFAVDMGGTFISQGYNGFNYGGGSGTNSWVNDTTLPISAVYGVPPTALGAAWSNGGTDLSMTTATPGTTFSLTSIDLNAGFNTTVTITGFVNGLAIAGDLWTGTINNSSLSYTSVLLNWLAIDTLTISNAPSANLFITNINTTPVENVPEPTFIALLVSGLLGFAASRRKNN